MYDNLCILWYVNLKGLVVLCDDECDYKYVQQEYHIPKEETISNYKPDISVFLIYLNNGQD